jgi:hypothetical protein
VNLIDEYRKLAEGGRQFFGNSLLNHEKEIGEFIRELGATSLLDYGCGAGMPYDSPYKVWKNWGLNPTFIRLYDPAFKEHSKPVTGKYDIVISSDVLEHIPEDQVDSVIQTMFSHARKGVWASICTRPAKKCFPGTKINMHVTLHPMQWWDDTFKEHAGGLPYRLVETP